MPPSERDAWPIDAVLYLLVRGSGGGPIISTPYSPITWTSLSMSGGVSGGGGRVGVGAGSPVSKKKRSITPPVERARKRASSDSTQKAWVMSRGAQTKLPGSAVITSSPT